MLCYREPTNPKDVKFKRISKAKSRSLEELRDQLRWQQILSDGEDFSDNNNMQENNCEKSDNDGDGIITNKTRNRLAALREYLKQYGGVTGISQRSLDSCSPIIPMVNDKDSSTCSKQVDDSNKSNK